MQEHESTFRQILLILHPPSITKTLGPSFDTIEQAVEVVNALDKYCIEDLSDVVEAGIMVNSPDVLSITHPGYLYVVGARLGWSKICQEAARSSLDFSEQALVRELSTKALNSVNDRVSMKDLLPLWKYRIACRVNAKRSFLNMRPDALA